MRTKSVDPSNPVIFLYVDYEMQVQTFLIKATARVDYIWEISIGLDSERSTLLCFDNAIGSSKSVSEQRKCHFNKV